MNALLIVFIIGCTVSVLGLHKVSLSYRCVTRYSSIRRFVHGGSTPSSEDRILRSITDARFRIRTQFISERDEVFTTKLSHNAKNIVSIVLVDYSVRDSSDLLHMNVPKWSKFLLKMQNSDQKLSIDKFLYSHDIGDDYVHQCKLARIPTEMYQKLALARTLVEGLSKGQQVVVTMVNQYGENFLDVDMCDALQAGCEAAVYPMPSFRAAIKGALTGGVSAVDSASAELGHDAENGIVFIIPQTLLETGNAEQGDSSETAREAGSEQDSKGAWHYFQQDSGEGSAEGTDLAQSRKEKLSALEAAMMEATKTENYFNARLSSPMASMLVSAETYSDLAQVQALLERRSATNQGTNIARALASFPPNVLNPQSFVSALSSLCGENDWIMDQWTVEQLAAMGAGAFCAVCQGNGRESSDRLVRIRWSPSANNSASSAFPKTGVTLSSVLSSSSSRKAERPLVLVGKGVTYDTGGINLKSANSMKTMKHDMAGSSVALGVFMALAKMKVSYPIECWLAIAENNNSPGAYRPDDVVTALTGETIEVVHSDAEGRMLLADVLSLASRKVRITGVHAVDDVLSPKYLLDFATLTGTCITSLTNRYIGALSNRKECVQPLITAGERSGERVWPFPCDDDFAEDLKSDIADVLQCRQPTEADHIYATSFLKRFVSPAVPWVHLDLGSAYRPGGQGHVSTDYTGSGVRAAIELLNQLEKADSQSK